YMGRVFEVLTRQPFWPTLAILLWLVVSGAGFKHLLDYEQTPGLAANAPLVWPRGSKIQPGSALPLLLVFVHPHCPCSRATLSELASIMTKCEGKVSATAVFYHPEEAGANWAKTDLWRSAEAIPGVTVCSDPDGTEAARFRVRTSGQGVLYDATGKLTFSGGITGARGHFGDNVSRGQVIALVTNGDTTATRCPVFGCPIFNHQRQISGGPDTDDR